MVFRRIATVAAAAAGLVAATPASAQFFFKSADVSGPRATGAEPGIVGPDLPGATATEQRAALVWNLRAALNVAALQCQFEPTLMSVDTYNVFIKEHEAELAAANKTLAGYFTRRAKTKREAATAQSAFDTRLYTGLSPSSAQLIFCQTAARIGQETMFTPRGRLYELAEARIRYLRNSLIPFGEQQFADITAPSIAAPPRLPRFDPRCWKGEVYNLTACGKL